MAKLAKATKKARQKAREKKANEKAKMLLAVRERELKYELEQRAKGLWVEPEKKEKKTGKERLFSPVSGKRVNEKDYANDVNEFLEAKANEMRLPLNKMRGFYNFARNMWKKNHEGKTMKAYIGEFFRETKEKHDVHYQEISIDRLADFLPDNIFNVESDENKEGYFTLFVNREYMTKPECLFFFRELEQDIRDHFLFFVGVLTDEINKTFHIDFDVAQLMNISDNTEEIMYEEHITFDKVVFKRILVKFSSN